MCDNLKKNVCVKIVLHAKIQARKEAIARNYFPRRTNFCLCSSRLPSLSCSVIFDQIHADILFRRVNYFS